MTNVLMKSMMNLQGPQAGHSVLTSANHACRRATPEELEAQQNAAMVMQ